MKTFNSLALVVLLLTFTVACKNGNSSEATSEVAADNTTQMLSETPKSVDKMPGMATLSFKIDGVLVESMFPGTYILFVPAKKEVNIMAKTSIGQFNIIIDNVEGTGSFTLKGNSKNGGGLMMPDKMYEVKKTGTPFSVTINNVEEIKAISAPEAKAIRGTFEGTLMDTAGDTVIITEGKFNSQ